MTVVELLIKKIVSKYGEKVDPQGFEHPQLDIAVIEIIALVQKNRNDPTFQTEYLAEKIERPTQTYEEQIRALESADPNFQGDPIADQKARSEVAYAEWWNDLPNSRELAAQTRCTHFDFHCLLKPLWMDAWILGNNDRN